jgi:hypothetical protein
MFTPVREAQTHLVRAARFASLVLFALALGAPAAGAQTAVALTFGGGSVLFPAPIAADLTSGSLEATDLLQFDVATSSEPVGSFTTSIYIRSSAATLGGGKPVADLEWRRDDDPAWHSLTTTDALVEGRIATGIPAGHSWSNSIHFRIALHWTGDPPATYTGSLVITVSTTQP